MEKIWQHLGKIILLSILSLLFLASACSNNKKHEYQGYIEGDFTYMASKFSGILKTLYVDEGTTVKQNQPLFDLDPEPESSQLAQAKSDLESTKNVLEDLKTGQRETILQSIKAQISQVESEIVLAKVRLQRAKTLLEKKVGTRDAYDEALSIFNSKIEQRKKLEADLKEAQQGSRVYLITAQESRIKSATDKVNELTWSLQQKKVVSPDIGYIYDTFFKQGEFVPDSRPVMSLLARQNIYAIFFVPIPEISSVHVKDDVEVTCDGCKKTYHFSVYFISPKIEFTPPVIYSRKNNYKYVYQVRASPKLEDALDFHLGQPIYVQAPIQEKK